VGTPAPPRIQSGTSMPTIPSISGFGGHASLCPPYHPEHIGVRSTVEIDKRFCDCTIVPDL
jgi:hypothetical protein